MHARKLPSWDSFSLFLASCFVVKCVGLNYNFTAVKDAFEFGGTSQIPLNTAFRCSGELMDLKLSWWNGEVLGNSDSPEILAIKPRIV